MAQSIIAMITFPKCVAVALLVGILVGGGTGSCTSDDAADEQNADDEQNAAETSDLAEQRRLIEQHRALVAKGGTFTSEQRELFADAYYSVGLSFFRERKRAESEPYFREAFRLWPRHARAVLRLGDLYLAAREFKAAAQAYERAAELDVALRQAVEERRAQLAELVLLLADQRRRDFQVYGAREALEFVEKHFGDIAGDEARERLKALAPLLRAQKLLDEAKEDIAREPKDQGYKKLRQVAMIYPKSYFAQEANRLLAENGQEMVLFDTATGYRLPRHWRCTVTEHFEIYYEKRRAVAGTVRHAEAAFKKIVDDFGMGDFEWKTRVTVYLFSDSDEWQAFLRMNEDRTMEWSGGFAVPSANEIYVHVTDSKGALYERLFPHELTHVLHHRYVGGIPQPLWLKEGLARWQEKGGVEEARRAIENLVKDDQAFTLPQLFSLTDYPEHAIKLFYAQSATVVGFIVAEYGLDALKDLMFAFSRTSDTRRALDEVLGIGLDTFEKKWKQYVR